MKILQIIDSLMVGGAQRLLVVFSEEMLKRGHLVEVATLLKRRIESPILTELEMLKIPIYHFPLFNLGDFISCIKMARFIKANQPDIVHTQLNYANIVGSLAAGISKIPCVASLHNSSSHLFCDHHYRTWLETWMLKNISRQIIACGFTVAHVQQPRFKSKILKVIPNPVPILSPLDSEKVQEFRRSQLDGGKEFLLVSVGRLIPEKGYPDLIRAMRIIKTHSNRKIRLVIAGDGPLLEQLRVMAAELGLAEIVQFLGQRSDIPIILAASDLYISSSHYEGQSLAVLEAMAAGLPLVVTDVGDNARVVSADRGILIPAGNPEKIAESVLRLMNNPEERNNMALAAKSGVLQDCSASVWADQLLAVYAEVLNG